MSSLRPSTLIYWTIGAVTTGFVAYAVYFDYKRRNDPDFRKALKRDARKQAKAAKEEEAQGEKKRKQQLKDMVDEANEEGYPKDAEDKEAYFMSEVSQGEQLCQNNAAQLEAAICFFRALKVYPQPTELMNIYDKTVPKPVLDVLAEMVAYDRVTGSASSESSTAGVE